MPVVTQTTLVTSSGVDAKVTSAVAAQLGTGGSVPRRFTAASITAMQALSDAVKGDLCVRTDFTPNRVYQLVGVYNVSTDWVDITSTTAAEWATLSGRPAVIAAGADAAAARSAIGAGTSSLALGSTGTTAKPGDWVPAASDLPASSVLRAAQNTDGTWPSRSSVDPAGTHKIVWEESDTWRDNPAYTQTLPSDAVTGRDSIELFV